MLFKNQCPLITNITKNRKLTIRKNKQFILTKLKRVQNPELVPPPQPVILA